MLARYIFLFRYHYDSFSILDNRTPTVDNVIIFTSRANKFCRLRWAGRKACEICLYMRPIKLSKPANQERSQLRWTFFPATHRKGQCTGIYVNYRQHLCVSLMPNYLFYRFWWTWYTYETLPWHSFGKLVSKRHTITFVT